LIFFWNPNLYTAHVPETQKWSPEGSTVYAFNSRPRLRGCGAGKAMLSVCVVANECGGRVGGISLIPGFPGTGGPINLIITSRCIVESGLYCINKALGHASIGLLAHTFLPNPSDTRVVAYLSRHE
jgi:hypothetical protein